MTRLVHRETGSTVEVPEEKAAKLYAMGYDRAEAQPKKAAAKKAETKKSSK